MVTALCHRGIKTHLIDPGAWALSVATDPDIVASVQDSWREKGAEVPHSVTEIPVQGLSGSHAYAQGKVAGTNAAGGQRTYQPVSVPWGMVAGDWMIGGVSFSETLATPAVHHVVVCTLRSCYPWPVLGLPPS